MELRRASSADATRWVVGCGSPHGDDAVGWEIARCLLQDRHFPRSVRVAQTPWDLLDLPPRLNGLLLIDAIQICEHLPSGAAGFGVPPTAPQAMRWRDAEVWQLGPPIRATHGADLREVVRWLIELQRLDGPLDLLGIPIDACEPGTGLSESARQQIPLAVKAVYNVLCEYREICAIAPTNDA